MKRAAAAACLAAVTIGLVAGYAVPAPEPSEVPATWELDFRNERPRPIRVTVPGADEPSTFWYLLYTLTNRTKKDRELAMQFVLYTDTGQVIRSGKKVPAAVFNTIRKTHNNPLLKDLGAKAGKILQGDDNAKDGVAIWRDFDPKAGKVDLFITGLSGDTALIKLPKPITVTERDAYGKVRTITKTEIILARTLQLTYQVAGEASARFTTPTKLLKKKWVMR